MRLLVLGGTRFVGRHLVAAALERGHRVSLFHRGRSGADLFPEAEHLLGDREGDLSALEGGRWDAVLDVSGYLPRVVRRSAERLAGAAERYLFVSSVSAYAPGPGPLDEDSPLATMEDEATEQITPRTYGPLKVLCEREVEEAFPGRALVVRPGMIVGPLDYTDRFPYWVRRAAEGGEVLAPGRPERPVQLIDARDLGAWMVRLVEDGATGAYSATGPEHPLTMRGMLEACREGTGGDARFTWADDGFLLREGVEPQDLPFWFPERDPQLQGVFEVSNRRALAAGLTLRPLSETVRNTLAWDRSRPAEERGKAGLSRAREAELLEAWRS